MENYRLVITGLGKWFNDRIIYESNDLESIKEWIVENMLADDDDEDTACALYDLVHDLESFNIFLDSTLSWDYLVTGRYKVKTIDEPKYIY